MNLTIDPFLPVAVVAAFAVVGFLLVGLGIARRVRGSIVRALAVSAFAIALLNPALQEEVREPLDGVVAVVVDKSQSQRAAGRADAADALAGGLLERLHATGGVEVRTVTVDRPA
ncbi:MAG: hypothetical protein AAGF49_09090, partial [Pseudomonadota bacterium]